MHPTLNPRPQALAAATTAMEDEVEHDEAAEDLYEDEVVVGQMPTVMVPRHIKKRSLRNTGLSISFNDKGLKEFVTGFHKRKKKRRKEAEKQLKEKDRLKRIEARKKRRLDMESALISQASLQEIDEDANGFQEDTLTPPSISGTLTYENADATIRVTTSEISKDEEEMTNLSRISTGLNKKAGCERTLFVKKRAIEAMKRKTQKYKKAASSRKGKHTKGSRH